MRRRFSWVNATALTFGFAFLYLPILILVVYSFNASQLVTVWGGFSTQLVWRRFSATRRCSTRPGSRSASPFSDRDCVATVLGTLAAVALVRYGRFPGGRSSPAWSTRRW